MNTPLTVATLVGQAWALAADGTRRALQAGDRLRVDETLEVAPGAEVSVRFGDNGIISFVGEQTTALQGVLPSVEPTAPQQQDAPLFADDGLSSISSGSVVLLEGHRFVQLVRIAEIIESDGVSPLSVAHIQETLRPLDMGYPEYPQELDDWREHRGGDDDHEGMASRQPGVRVELQGAGEDGIYNDDEIGTDGTVTARVTLDDQVVVGDDLVVTDGEGTVLLERPVTQEDLDNGLDVEVPVLPGQTEVIVKAKVSDSSGHTGQSDDDKPVDNLRPEPLVAERLDADDDDIDLNLDTYFSDVNTVTYEVQGLPPGLSVDPVTGHIVGTLDSSASQGGPQSDGKYPVSIVATDAVGNITSHVLTWTVTNPAPEARDDIQTIDEDTLGGSGSGSGNVLTGQGADNGSAAADSDPDGDALQVTGVEAGDNGNSPAGQLSTAITGQYGELTLNADGSYSYVLDNDNSLVNGLKDGDTLSDVFTYTISDGEGGEDTATLTIVINGSTDGDPAVVIPDLNGVEVGDNSIAEDASTPVTGTLELTAPDGLKEISVGGTTVTAAELADLGNAPVVITGSEGTLTLTGFDDATGKLTYSYQQSGTNKDHNGGDVTDSFAVTTTDNGDTTSAPQDLVILITDTVPLANPDTNSVTEDAATPATGNVMTDSGAGEDELGADATTVTGVTKGTAELTTELSGSVGSDVVGDYGTLTLGSDGEYSYSLDDNNAAVNGLKDGQTLTDTFSYTIKDADGDWSTTTVTITINGSTDGTPTIGVPDLNGMDVGDNSIVENATTPVTGTIELSTPDGLKEISVGGTTVTVAELADLDNTPVVITGSEGNLTLTDFDPQTGVVTYSYQQSGTNKDHSGSDVTDTFEVTVTDNGDTTSAPDNLVILITDTAPVANPDTNSVDEDSGIPATGNVMTDSGTGEDDLGADATTVTGVTKGTTDSTTELSGSVGTDVAGDYGTLTLGSDGEYSYSLDNDNAMVNALKDGETLTDTFSYTIKDADGDWSTTTVTITINGNNDGAPEIVPLDGNGDDSSGLAAEGHATVYESGLTTDGPGGQSSSTTGTISLSAADGLAGVTIGDGPNAVTLTLTQLQNLGSSTPTVTTEYGTLTLTGFTASASVGGVPTEADLQYSYTLDRPYDNEALGEDDNGFDSISLGIEDAAGEVDTSTLQVNIIDDAPSVGGAENGAVNEAGLAGGSQEGDVAAPVTVSGDLGVRVGADNTPADGPADVRFSADQSALDALNLTSGYNGVGDPVALQYVTSADGHTITAYKGDGRAEGNQVFTVTVIDSASSDASYQFTLKGALNHEGAATLELPFAFDVTDGDNDTADGSFTITVVDDAPQTSKVITVDEDSGTGDAANTFNTSADANPENTTVLVDGITLDASTNGDGSVTYTYPTGTADGDKSFFGSVTVNVNGSITFVPAADYSNAGGGDSFKYQTVNGGDVTTVDVTVNVTPVADAPLLGSDAASITTDEDVAVALGLNAPVGKDLTDQNGNATDGDNPELLGVITLSGIPAGASLLDGNDSDASLFESTGDPITIVISDGQHISGITGNTLTLTTAQFEALKVLPPTDAHENFSVDMAVTSYEVDDSGVPIPGVAGADASISVGVDVQAVTDPVSLAFDDNSDTRDLTINEDSSYDLTAALKVDYPDNDGNTVADLDGSEERWFEISGLPEGSTVTTADGVIEVTAANPVVTVPAPGLSGSSTILPQMEISPPADYSGSAVAVTVTLKAQDRDGDSPSAAPVIEQDSVTLNLQVDPVADEPAVKGVTTPEDTPVTFLQNVGPGDTDGSEELTSITVKDIPAGWVVEDHNGDLLTPVGGELVIDPVDVASGDYKNYTIQAPEHSSEDATLTLDIGVRDNSNDGSLGPVTDSFTGIELKVKVTPVAETVDSDTNGDTNNDVTLTPGHDYSTPGAEDQWFVLGQESGFNLSAGWGNEDSSSEKTFALLTPNLVTGDGSNADALGSSFRYSTDGGTTWVTQTYGGDPIEVPLEYLDTLQFKAAPDFSGTFTIGVEAMTRDYDEDDLAGRTLDELTPAELAALSYDEAVSGSAELTNVLITPVADTATATVTAHVRGNEDEEMPLSIRPSSSDPSETFNVTISAIPDGATLTYDGVTLTSDATGLPPGYSIVSAGDGTWSVAIEGFEAAKGGAMTITAPLNSNEPFTLKVDTASVDTLTIPGDPSSTYTDVSSSYQLDILVTPKGVADPADLTIVDPADQSFDEATVDSNGGVLLSELVTQAELTDTDGSEVLSFKVSNLPEGFTLIGGTLIGDGVWSLTAAQLQTAKLVTPANFNGTASFDLFAVTTENDGDSLTAPHVVSVRVTPSPEATINLAASIDEDVSTALSFDIQHQNGDTDEQLDAVWLNAAEVDGATDFSLTYGDGGMDLAQATAGGSPGITLEDGWYKLSGAALDSIYAQGRANWSGSADLTVRYFITDPAADGTVSDVQASTDGTYNISVNPITDQPELTVTAGNDTSLSDPADVDVVLNIANQGGDYDGSEQLNRIILDNVPDGVIVENGEYLGNGQWLLAPDTAFNAELTPTVTLKVQSRAGGLTDHPIKVTVISEDSNNGQQLSDSTTITLTTSFQPGETTPPAEILQWEQNSFEPTEDAAFNLGQGIDAQIEDGVTDNGFTITLTNLPEGTTVTGMRLTVIDGQQVWTASGTGGDAELQTLLDSITVTPPADFNKHDGTFEYDAKLTTYIPSGDRAEAEITVQQSVVPVTDDADIAISAPTVDEGSDLAISIDITNAADDPNWTLIDGNLYVTVDEPTEMQGGVLKDAGGNPLTQTAVSGVDGVPDGTYYVIDVSGSGNQVDLLYTPKDEHVSGSINLSVIAKGQELDSTVIKTTTVAAAGTIAPVNSGYDFTVDPTSGSENAFPQATSDKSNVIQIAVNDNGLVDADGSESVGTILLKNLPNGFLVYVGSSAADATLANLGSNTGTNDNGTNTWLLGSGELPKYIGILPPAHWSGTLSDLQLVVNSQEDSLSEINATARDFALTVEPVADGVELTPTPSFGDEGDIIPLNLNAEMNDLEQVGPNDTSVETISLQFKGMGEHTAFYIDGVLISGGPNVTFADGVYTLTGLTQDQLGKLGFVQGESSLGAVQVRAQTVESANGDTSEWTHEAGETWAEIDVTITPQYGTTGDDQLLWTGDMVDGRGGDDTIQLRFDETLSGSDLSSVLRNIETIDMTGRGADSITGLTAEDVFDMTDSRNTLRIDGDAGGVDTVGLDIGWTLDAGAGVVGYDVYTATVSSQSVTLEVASGVLIE